MFLICCPNQCTLELWWGLLMKLCHICHTFFYIPQWFSVWTNIWIRVYLCQNFCDRGMYSDECDQNGFCLISAVPNSLERRLLEKVIILGKSYKKEPKRASSTQVGASSAIDLVRMERVRTGKSRNKKQERVRIEQVLTARVEKQGRVRTERVDTEWVLTVSAVKQ